MSAARRNGSGYCAGPPPLWRLGRGPDVPRGPLPGDCSPWRRVLQVLCGGLLFAAAACSADTGMPLYPNTGAAQDLNVGLYTPGSTLGATQLTTPDAGVDASVEDPTGDRCVGVSADAGTPGTLTVDFTTTPIGERWGPANVGAVWIEDASGVYVETLERWAALRAGSLYRWKAHACTSAWPEMDAMTGATLATHGTPHHDVWNGKDFKGTLAPDGTYELFIEVTETELNYGPLAMYEFHKGPKPEMLAPPDKPPHAGLKISYMPSGQP